MKKRIILITSLIIIIGVVLIKGVDDKKTFKQDGVIFALTMDGETITSFPEQGEYSVDIECENGKGKWLVEEWKVAIEKISGNVTCNIDFQSNPTSLKTEVESKAQTNVNGYRYSGKQPDNWVEFNNEMWQIIGSIPVTLSDGTTSNLVKIIKSESIGGLVFNSAASNTTWGSNTLYDLLNNYYYGKKDATGGSSCSAYMASSYALCNYEDIGISSDSTDYYGKMIKDVYWNVGTVSGVAVGISATYAKETATKTVTGKIGLMNASDYGYATSGITYSSVGLSSLGSYEQNNWLFGQYNEWTLTPSSTTNMLDILYDASISTATATNGYTVRPVVYLDSSVYIVSGDGSINNPYIIGMN